MSDSGLQRQLEKIQESSNALRDCIRQLYADGTKSVQEDMFITMPRQFGRTHIYDSISQDEYQQASQSLSDYAEQYKQSTDSRILTLKSQLKHCKNYLERQNIERKLNRLYKERR